MKLYKVTAEDGSAFHGGTGRWVKGRWRSVAGEIIPCERGLHLCREQDLVRWLGPVIWEAEAEGSLIVEVDKVIARRARVTRRLDTWNERTARLFAADCAERVLPLFEAACPDDDRPRRAIAAARAFARGEMAETDRAAAGAAAGAAAWDAAWAATRAAAGGAAWAAAWAATRAAAWAATRAAAGDAERAWQTARLMAYLRGDVA